MMDFILVKLQACVQTATLLSPLMFNHHAYKQTSPQILFCAEN